MMKGMVVGLAIKVELTKTGYMVISALLSLLVVFLFIRCLCGKDGLRKLLHRNRFVSVLVKIAAIIGTLLLATSDFYSVRTLFQNAKGLATKVFVLMGMDIGVPDILGVTFAAFLEGFPFLLGLFLSKLTDSTNYRDSTKVPNWIGTIFMILALVAAWGLSVAQRVEMLRDMIVEDSNLAADEVVQFAQIMSDAPPHQVFMMVAPILTSILAFGLSWLAFPAKGLEAQEDEVEYRQKRYLWYRKQYQKRLLRYQQRKTRLWTALAGGDEGDPLDMPADPNIYQNRCQQLIRRKTVSACVGAFGNEFGRYNDAVEARLAEYIMGLSERSTLPFEISSITVEEVLAAYEKDVRARNLDGDLWDDGKLRIEKQERLRRELDNAACRAEFWFFTKRKK